jgi:hypothetical protein
LLQQVSPKTSPAKGMRKPPKPSRSPDPVQAKETFVDYTNCVLSYNCPETDRPGHGIVGEYVKKQKLFVVNFTFLDNEAPYTQVDMLPLRFLRSHLVDANTAQTWIDEVERHKNIDSPATRKRKAATTHTTNKRNSTKINGTQEDQRGKTNVEEQPPKPSSATEKAAVDTLQTLKDDAKAYEKKNPKGKRDGISKRAAPPADRSDSSQLDEEDVVHDATGITSPITSSGTPRNNSSQSLGSAEKNNLDPGIIALIQHAVRDATYAISPSSERLRPFMYWNTDKKTACTKMLIKRTPSLQLIADKYPRNAFARLYAKLTNKAANNERSAQIRQLKLLFLDDKSPFCMISDYKMGGSSNATIQKEMRISSSLRDEFETIDDLRDALIAGTMYKYPLLFDLFCGGLESGKIRGIPKMDMSPIEDIIQVAHEAHFRLELWYAMVNHAYRHEPSKVQRTSRHAKHTALCALVTLERRECATHAFKHRSSVFGSQEAQCDSSSDDDTGVPEEFY